MNNRNPQRNHILRLITGIPLRLEKSGKIGSHFPVREKFEQTGKVRENHTKYWKIQGISDKYCLLFFAGSLESAYSLNWGAREIWGKGGGETLALL